MKLILIIITFISTNCYSQNTFSYLGTLVLSDNSPISFSLELQEDLGDLGDKEENTNDSKKAEGLDNDEDLDEITLKPVS